MQKLLNKLNTWFNRDLVQVGFLFIITFIAHGAFIPWLGLYGDDWGFLWLSYKALRPEILITRSRFFLPELYTFVAKVLPPIPLHWHIFYFLMFFSNVLLLWLLIKKIWSEQKKMRIWISLGYALYPGALTSLQPVTFWWIYFQFSLLFASFIVMLKALSDSKNKVLLTLISILFMLGALMFSEYIFFLELLRLPIIFLFQKNRNKDAKKPFSNSIKAYVPYLLTFIGLVIIRIFNQRRLSAYYRVDADQFLSNPLDALIYFISRIFTDSAKNGLFAWIKPLFDPQLYVNSGFISLILFIAIAFMSMLIFLGVSYAFPREKQESNNSLFLVGFGFLGVFLANLPFWLGNLFIDVGVGIFSRFSIPAVLGSAFLLYGLVTLIKNPHISTLVFSLLCGLSVLMHLLTGNLFRKEWEFQNRLYWEMAWRMPGITPGTTFLSNVTPLWMVSENTLSAATNWIYMDQEPPIKYIDYYLYYDMDKFQDEVPHEPDKYFVLGHYSGVFAGISSNIIVINHNPPACFTVVNDRWDQYNPDIPAHLREAAVLYAKDLIEPQGNAELSLKQNPIFQQENRNKICYFFHKASLAAEAEDWQKVNELWREAASQGLEPKFAAEYIPFIQAFAHLNQYDDAFGLSVEVIDFFKYYKPMICDFWNEMMKDGRLNNELILQFTNQEIMCEFNDS